MNTLVTGASGFTGKYLVKELLLRNFKVKALVRTSKGESSLMDFLASTPTDNLSVIYGNVLDKKLLTEAINDVSVVFHAAAIVSFKKSDYGQMFKTNVEGTQTLIDTILESNRKIKLVHFSSIATLKKPTEDSPSDETHFEKPLSDNGYALSKYYSELEVWRGITEGLNAVILNPAVILGYEKSGRSSSNLLKVFSKKLPFITDGVTGFVDVNDVCLAAIELAFSDIQAERFLLCSSNLTYSELYRLVHHQMGNQHTPRKIPQQILFWVGLLSEAISLLPGINLPFSRQMVKSAFNRSYYLGDKICQTLGFSYTPIEQTIENHLKHLRDNRDR